MSFALMTTTTATATSTHSSALRRYHNMLGKGVIKPHTLCLRKQNLHFMSCKLQEGKDHGDIIDRRNVLIGLGSLGAAAASNIFDKNTIANAGNETARSQPIQTVPEFGPKPRPLDQPIRALVDRPKKKEDTEEVLIVYGVNIPNNDPLRFDVYVDKPVYGDGGLIMDDDPKDYGQCAGSMVDLAHTRVGRKAPYGSLDLGISDLIEDIEAEDSNKLVVTLVPRSGHVIIGGVRIERWDYED